jgi:hypothetical protein
MNEMDNKNMNLNWQYRSQPIHIRLKNERNRAYSKAGAYSKIEKENVKISIDDIIDLYTQRKLRYTRNRILSLPSKSTGLEFRHGDYFVDYSNPLVSSVLDRLDDINKKMEDIYEVKVLEDHLDNLAGLGKRVLVDCYMLSGLGIAHMFINMLRDKDNPLEKSILYCLGRGVVDMTADFFKSRSFKNIAYSSARGFAKSVKYTGKGLGYTAIGIPLLTYWVGRALYNNAFYPFARLTHPKRYSLYIHLVKESAIERFKTYKINRSLSKKERKEKAEKKKEAKQRVKLIKKEVKEKRRERIKKQSQSFLRNTWEKVSNTYKNSIINEYWGYSLRFNNYFDNIDKNKINYISDVCGVGKMHTEVFDYVIGMDKLVAKALKKKPYDFVLTNKKFSEWGVLGGIGLDKKGKVHINIKDESLSYNFLQRQKARRLGEQIDDKTKVSVKTKCDFDTLELLLHQRAHDEVSQYGHPRDARYMSSSYHRKDFYKIKARLRREFVDYIESKKIELSDYADSLAPAYEEFPFLYHLNKDALKSLILMPRRMLRKERIKFDEIKEEAKKSREEMEEQGYSYD